MNGESISVQLERRATAERIITGFYTRLKRRPPLFLWFDDPMSGVLACALLSLLSSDPAWRFLMERFEPLPFKVPVGGQIRGALWAQLATLLNHEARNHLAHPKPSPNFLDRFWRSFRPQLELRVGGLLALKLRRLLHVPGILSGQRMESDPGFWGGATGHPRVRPGASAKTAAELDELQHACGWWSPRAYAVICSDGPRRIRVDVDARLHAEDGPAVALSEEHGVYAWHGTAVPAEWIERNGTLDPLTLLTWPDVDQRVAAGQIFGWAKLLEHRPGRVIHADPDPQIGTLFECDLPECGPSRFIRVRCGTGREFVLSVPLHVHTAREAGAWTYALTSNQYEPEARA